jgi:hypothetical protein
MEFQIDDHVDIFPIQDRKKVSQRTRNKIHEHGSSGFIILQEPTVPSFCTRGANWIRVRSLEENVSLSRWGRPGEKEAWSGWLPMAEIRIEENEYT